MRTEAIPEAVAHDATIVALTPAEMPGAQAQLLAWTDRQLAMLREEARDLDEHRAIAKANGWKLQAVERRLAMTRRRLVYYDKLRAAVAAGYLLVPNMPVDVFAVRVVDREAAPPVQYHESGWRRPMEPSPERLPAGAGEYVGAELAQHRESWLEPDPNNPAKTVTRYRWESDAYTEVDFPVKTARAVVLDATARAMALKVFDQIGVVRDAGVVHASKGDPIVVGQILDPRARGRGVTFFVAWWLDPTTL